jgi:hypothetical protein
VIFTWDRLYDDIWLTRDYFPEIPEQGKAICPPLDTYRAYFHRVEIRPVPVPHDCADGFLQAYWRRPEAYFDPHARSAISAFAGIDVEPGLTALRRDLSDGTWARRNRDVLIETERDLGYRLVIGDRA